MNINNFVGELYHLKKEKEVLDIMRRSILILYMATLLCCIGAIFGMYSIRENIRNLLGITILALLGGSHYNLNRIKLRLLKQRCHKRAKELLPQYLDKIVAEISCFPPEEREVVLWIGRHYSGEEEETETIGYPILLEIAIALNLRHHLMNIGIAEYAYTREQIKQTASKILEELSEKTDSESIQRIHSVNNSLLALKELEVIYAKLRKCRLDEGIIDRLSTVC